MPCSRQGESDQVAHSARRHIWVLYTQPVTLALLLLLLLSRLSRALMYCLLRALHMCMPGAIVKASMHAMSHAQWPIGIASDRQIEDHTCFLESFSKNLAHYRRLRSQTPVD